MTFLAFQLLLLLVKNPLHYFQVNIIYSVGVSGLVISLFIRSFICLIVCVHVCVCVRELLNYTVSA